MSGRGRVSCDDVSQDDGHDDGATGRWQSDEGPVGLVPFARFDDLRNGHALVFGDQSRRGGTLVAHRPGQVLPVLRAVDAAAARGWWAVGFLAYEASTGLDPTLATRPLAPGEAFDKLPLAWFGLFGRPECARPPEPAAEPAPEPPGCYTVTPWLADTTADDYTRKLEAVRSHIRDGNTYQCNLTVRLRSRAAGDLLALLPGSPPWHRKVRTTPTSTRGASSSPACLRNCSSTGPMTGSRRGR